MIHFSQQTLTKLEDLLKANGFKIRYEKGHFKSGACKLLNDNILVINKFSDVEVKVNYMLQIIQEADFSKARLDDKQKKFLSLIQQTKLIL